MRRGPTPPLRRISDVELSVRERFKWEPEWMFARTPPCKFRRLLAFRSLCGVLDRPEILFGDLVRFPCDRSEVFDQSSDHTRIRRAKRDLPNRATESLLREVRRADNRNAVRHEQLRMAPPMATHTLVAETLDQTPQRTHIDVDSKAEIEVDDDAHILW